jgi:hypothetical protein
MEGWTARRTIQIHAACDTQTDRADLTDNLPDVEDLDTHTATETGYTATGLA